jgi:hypothetical protein
MCSVCLEYNSDESAPTEIVSHDHLEVMGHGNPAYNGVYARGNDWNDAPHFVMGDRHLYLQSNYYW